MSSTSQETLRAAQAAKEQRMIWIQAEKDQRESIERVVANARDARVPYPPQSDMGMIIWLLDALKAAETERNQWHVLFTQADQTGADLARRVEELTEDRDREIRAAKAEGWDEGPRARQMRRLLSSLASGSR